MATKNQHQSVSLLNAGQRQQVAVIEALEATGVHIGGWKLGLTSGTSRDAMGDGFRPFGFVRADRIIESPGQLDWHEVQHNGLAGGLETEVCFTLTRTLAGNVDAKQASASVLVAPAFEINQVRIPADASNADRIADNLSNWGIVVGASQPLPAAWDADNLRVAIGRDSAVRSTTVARGHIDNHFVSIATLANRLQEYGRVLAKGDRVITGAFDRVRAPDPGVWFGDFAELGRVELTVVA